MSDLVKMAKAFTAATTSPESKRIAVTVEARPNVNTVDYKKVVVQFPAPKREI